ncbi:MAG: hypothetical protein ACK4P3_09520 [Fimbriimonadaceae bacterium]
MKNKETTKLFVTSFGFGALALVALCSVSTAQTFEYEFNTLVRTEVTPEAAREQALSILKNVSRKSNPTEDEIAFIVDQKLRLGEGIPLTGTFAFGIDGSKRTVRIPKASPLQGHSIADSFYYTDGDVLFGKMDQSRFWSVSENSSIPSVSHPGAAFVFAGKLDERFQILKTEGSTVHYGFTIEQRPQGPEAHLFPTGTYTLTYLMKVEYADDAHTLPTFVDLAHHYGPLDTWEDSHRFMMRQAKLTGSIASGEYSIKERMSRNLSWDDETIKRYELVSVNDEVWTPETHLEHGTSIHDSRESIGDSRSYRWTGSLYEPPVASNIPMFVWPLGGALLCLGAGVFFWRKR